MAKQDDNQEVKRVIDTNEDQLNNLFKEVLDGLRDDIIEAQLNVEIYKNAMTVDGGKELYGQLCNSALSIKGSARDRQLKFLNTFKDRVSKKEAIAIAKEMKEKDGKASGTAQSHADVIKLLEEMKKNGTLDSINLDDEDEDDK